jgi:methionine-rich copper-binding protein CopC
MNLRSVLPAICLWTASAATAVAAAPQLRQTSLSEGEWVEISPFTFTMVFDELVTLDRMWLVDRYGAETPINAAGRAGEYIIVPFPVLVPHHYRIHWQGHDRHNIAVEGSLGFAIRGCEEVEGAD